ncbi:MAG TPA: alpha/beta fold hydrolase [Gemmatimonadales bacterium]|nr:alpha/beta fold hydrolase [Gemmatimonadales bacterium]
MASSEWRVAVGEHQTSVAWDHATAAGTGTVFVCAHGAGGHMSDRSMLQLSGELLSRGLDVVRFDFLYRALGSKRPDPMPRLRDCFAAVVDSVRQRLNPRTLLIGGRSMGGRAASMMAADGFACDGLLLFAYPLHPAGRPDQLRSAHLSSIRCPVLCFNGTRDALCREDLMRQAVAAAGSIWTMHWLPGADHSFHVLKSSGTTDAAILAEVGRTTEGWLTHLRSHA